jgi:hypothetical protein
MSASVASGNGNAAAVVAIHADDDDDIIDDPTLPDGSHYNSAAGRRKSVFTEPYNPEDDEDDTKPVSNHIQYAEWNGVDSLAEFAC